MLLNYKVSVSHVADRPCFYAAEKGKIFLKKVFSLLKLWRKNPKYFIRRAFLRLTSCIEDKMWLTRYTWNCKQWRKYIIDFVSAVTILDIFFIRASFSVQLVNVHSCGWQQCFRYVNWKSQEMNNFHLKPWKCRVI